MLWGCSNSKNLPCRVFAFAFALFCAYVQYSPAIDLDWVTIDGRDYYTGATTPPQRDQISPQKQGRGHLGNDHKPRNLNAYGRVPPAGGQLPPWHLLTPYVIERSERVYVQPYYQPLDNRGPPIS